MYRYVLFILLLAACVSPKQVDLFDEKNPQKAPKGIKSFYATEIYKDFITSEIWFTQSASCLKVEASKDEKHTGEASLHLKWDKISQSCEWLGIGFGWDAWNGKNIKPIINESAIEMWVKLKEGRRSSLPLAACLEDYSGGQAWLGFSDNVVVGDAITDEWTLLRLPLSEFGWKENNADPSNIKQLIIQFEADGDIYVDEMRIVPFKGSYRQRAYVDLTNLDLNIDGKVEPAWGKPIIDIDGNKIYISSNNESLYLAGEIRDESPLQNKQEGDQIWDGDAIEFAFSTDPGLSKTRSYLRTTDQHIGIKLSKSPTVWSWQTHETLDGALVHTSIVGDKVHFEAKIPLSSFGEFEFSPNAIYGLEVAIDQGEAGQRRAQIRWNTPSNEGFNRNPGMWGELIFTKTGY